jgi:hypothetical protein
MNDMDDRTAARMRREPPAVHWVAAGQPVSRHDLIEAVEQRAELQALRAAIGHFLVVLDALPPAARELTIRFLMDTYQIR